MHVNNRKNVPKNIRKANKDVSISKDTRSPTCKSAILINWYLYGRSIRGVPISTFASRALLGPIFITCELIDIIMKHVKRFINA